MPIKRMTDTGRSLLNAFMSCRGRLGESDFVFLLDEINRQIKTRHIEEFPSYAEVTRYESESHKRSEE